MVGVRLEGLDFLLLEEQKVVHVLIQVLVELTDLVLSCRHGRCRLRQIGMTNRLLNRWHGLPFNLGNSGVVHQLLKEWFAAVHPKQILDNLLELDEVGAFIRLPLQHHQQQALHVV